MAAAPVREQLHRDERWICSGHNVRTLGIGKKHPRAAGRKRNESFLVLIQAGTSMKAVVNDLMKRACLLPINL